MIMFRLQKVSQKFDLNSLRCWEDLKLAHHLDSTPPGQEGCSASEMMARLRGSLLPSLPPLCPQQPQHPKSPAKPTLCCSIPAAEDLLPPFPNEMSCKGALVVPKGQWPVGVRGQELQCRHSTAQHSAGRHLGGIHGVSSVQAFFNKNMSQLLAWAVDFLNIPSYPEKGEKKKKENGRGGLRGKKRKKIKEKENREKGQN